MMTFIYTVKYIFKTTECVNNITVHTNLKLIVWITLMLWQI